MEEIKYNCVAGFMFSEDFKAVALIHKNRPDWQAGRINAVGGKIEDKDISEWGAMAREFAEETGVITSPSQWWRFAELSDRRQYKVHFFYSVSDDVYKIESKTDELVAVYPTERLPKDVLANLKWLVPMAMTLAQREDLTIAFDITEVVNS